MPPPDMRWVDFNLDDIGVLRIELAPSKIGTKQQKRVAIQQGMVTRLPTKNARHPNIVGIFVFDGILCPGGMGNRCFELLSDCNDLVMCVPAARSSVNCHSGAV